MASGINIYSQLLILTIRTVSPPGFIRQAYVMPLLLSFLFFHLFLFYRSLGSKRSRKIQDRSSPNFQVSRLVKKRCHGNQF